MTTASTSYTEYQTVPTLVDLVERFSNPHFAGQLGRLEGVMARLSAAGPSARPTRPKRKPQRRLDEGEVDSLVDSRKKGATIKDLATAFGIHRTTVMAHLKRRQAGR